MKGMEDCKCHTRSKIHYNHEHRRTQHRKETFFTSNKTQNRMHDKYILLTSSFWRPFCLLLKVPYFYPPPCLRFTTERSPRRAQREKAEVKRNYRHLAATIRITINTAHARAVCAFFEHTKTEYRKTIQINKCDSYFQVTRKLKMKIKLTIYWIFYFFITLPSFGSLNKRAFFRAMRPSMRSSLQTSYMYLRIRKQLQASQGSQVPQVSQVFYGYNHVNIR